MPHKTCSLWGISLRVGSISDWVSAPPTNNYIDRLVSFVELLSPIVLLFKIWMPIFEVEEDDSHVSISNLMNQGFA